MINEKFNKILLDPKILLQPQTDQTVKTFPFTSFIPMAVVSFTYNFLNKSFVKQKKKRKKQWSNNIYSLQYNFFLSGFGG